MFSEPERRALRGELVAAARADERITAAALVGSAAHDSEDHWSDIDLAFRLAPDLTPADLVDEWTARMHDVHGAVAHLDIWSGPSLFRVFLLANSLQVDLSFWPSGEFASMGRPFRLLFGAANKPKPVRTRGSDALIGRGWLYALHARSSIARGRLMQALYMINGIRDQVVTLACLRCGLPPDEGRGVDDLPAGIKRTLADTLVRDLTPDEMRRAFGAVAQALLVEATDVDPTQAAQLEGPVRELVRTAAPADPNDQRSR